MGWRAQIAAGYPWKSLVFVGVMVIFVLASIYGVFVGNPAERAVMAHGTTTTAHAVAWKDYTTRRDSYQWVATLRWTDAHGHPHEQGELEISDAAAAFIGHGRDVEIRYLGDRAVIAMDTTFRRRDESNGPVLLVVFAICALLGLYHWRRRLHEWRADQNPPAPW